MAKQIYCSLDIEGTGLDPVKDQIIEVGAVLFEIGKDGEVKFGREFSQLVKPTIPVPPFIQDLTNIRTSDLQDAPAWEKVRPDFEKFIGKHPIVGQNIQFDLSFLSSHGLNFKQPVIDTKDLAQIFLPQAKYYNLEYLLRYFGITIENHHRATSDSKSTALLLQQILQAARGLPVSTQNFINDVLQASKLPFKNLFFSKKPQQRTTNAEARRQGELFGAQILPAADAPAQKTLELEEVYQTPGRFLVNLPLVLNNAETIRQLVVTGQRQQEGAVLSFGTKEELNFAAQFADRKEWQILDDEKNYFCPVRFAELLKRQPFANQLATFLLKVIIWQATVMESKNFSALFLVGEDYNYRDLVCGDLEICSAHEPACEFQMALAAAKPQSRILTTHAAWLKIRKVRAGEKLAREIFWDAAALEKALLDFEIRTVTLKSARFLFSSLYDPESGGGLLAEPPAKIKKAIEQILNQLDLNFGLWSIQINDEMFGASQHVVDTEFRDRDFFSKLQQSAEALLDSFAEFQKAFGAVAHKSKGEVAKINRQISQLQDFLTEFFLQPRAENFYWLDTYGGRLKLKVRPRALKLPKSNTRSEGFFGTFSNRSTKDYFLNFFDNSDLPEITLAVPRPELEVWLPNNFPVPASPKSQQVLADFFRSVLPKLPGRSVILFNSQKNVEEIFIALSAGELKPRLLGQRISGHHWKNAESYATNDQAIWLMTAHNFAQRIEELPDTRNIFIARLPYETLGIFEACHDEENIFSEVVMPRTQIRLEKIWRCFISAGETKDKKIIFCDPRIQQEYNSALLSSLASQFTVITKDFAPNDADLLAED